MKTLTTVALLASLACASASNADQQAAFKAIGLSGSERLAVFALSDPRLPEAARTERAKILKDFGFGLERGRIGSHSLTFSPILAWDGNLNGGLANDSLSYDGLTFSVNPDYKAKAGLLIGGSVRGRTQISLGGPTALDLRYGGMLGYAPEHDVTKASVQAEACVKNLRSPKLGLHGCVDLSHSVVELGSSSRIGARAGVSASFEALGGYHDVTFEAGVNRHFGGNDYTQRLIGARIVSAHANGIATKASLKLGTKVEGVNAMLYKIDLAATFTAFDRPITVSLATQRNTGGTFLGQARHDQITSLSVSGNISKRIHATLSLSDTSSSADFYNDSSVGLDLNFKF